MNEKFTPGPWQVHRHHHINNELWLSVLQGAWDITHNHAREPGVIADSRYSAMGDEANLANAHLIAAAPDLYEIGLRILKKLDHETECVTHMDAELLRKALAKARGEA